MSIKKTIAVKFLSDCDFQKHFSAGLIALRKSMGLNQGQLSEKSGVARVTISRTETGTRPTPWDDAYALAAVFNLTPEGVMAFGGGGKPDADPPPAPEVAEWLQKAQQVLEGPKGEALKTVIESMLKE